jgi:hypothetical protein
MQKIENAIIEDTMLGIEDHGIGTCFLYLKMDGTGQGFGGYALWSPNQLKNEINKPKVDYCGLWLTKILEITECSKWEDVKGKLIRISHTMDKIDGIGHIIKDKWFYPEAEINAIQAMPTWRDKKQEDLLFDNEAQLV